MLLQSQLCHGGSVADLLPGDNCSPVLCFLHNSHGYTFLNNILLRISYSSVKHFADLSWIVEDLPCLSAIRSLTSWYTLLLMVLFRQVSISSHWEPIQSSFAFFTALRIFLFASLYPFASSASYRFLFKSLLSSHEHFWWPKTFPATIIPKYLTGWFSHCCIVYWCPCPHLSVQWVVRISHLSLLEKCKQYLLGPSTSHDQTLFLASLAFSPSSSELESSSSTGHGHFRCLLQESSLSYGC